MKAASEAAALDRSLVLLIFGADWCATCRELEEKTLASPQFRQQGGLLHVAEADVDSDPKMARAFDVNAVPTLVLMTADNKIVARREGFLDTATLLSWLDEGRSRVKEGRWEGTAPGSKLASLAAKAATDILGPADVTQLVSMLEEPDPAQRTETAKLLAAQRERALVPLIEAVTNSYLGVRIAAGDLLHQLASDSIPVDPWQSPAELADTVAALKKWWAETGTLPPSTQQPAADPAAADSTRAALDALRGDDPVRRTRAMSTLAAQGAAALPFVRDAIRTCERTGDQRSLALLADIRWAILVPDDLGQRVGGARHALARGTGQERLAAVSQLGDVGHAAIPALAELANDSDLLVVEGAVRALASIGGKDSVPAMAGLLKAANDNVRMTAAQALGHTKNTEAVRPLLTVLDDPNEVVACAALAALEEIHSERAYSFSRGEPPPDLVAGLKTGLADPRWRVRAAAAEVAGKLQLTVLAPELTQRLEDTDGFVVRNALAALRNINATPETDRLATLARRHPGLRGEAVALLVSRPTEEAVRAVNDMYNAAGADVRLVILRSLQNGAATGGNDPATTWQPLLGRAAAETDPRLRRAAAQSLGAQPAAVAAPLVGPLLSDQDTETRSAAVAIVLSILGGEPVVVSNHAGESFAGISDFDFETPASNKKRNQTNSPPATAEQISAWHAALKQMAGPSPDLLQAAGIFVTGSSNADLPVLQAAFERADKAAVDRLAQSPGLAAILPRLPWPEAKPLVDRLCVTPALFFRTLAYTRKVTPQVGQYLLEPARFRASVERSSPEQTAQVLPGLLSTDPLHWSLLSDLPGTAPILDALLESTNAAWRAAAIYSLAHRDDRKEPAVFEKAARDSNAWVRAAAVPGLIRQSKDRPALEVRLAPLLADPDPHVARQAALGLLEPETLAAADWDYLAASFEFEKVRAHSGNYNSDGNQRPLVVLETKPPFLDSARQRLANAAPEDVAVFALLLAQYGDFTGVDRLLETAGNAKERPPGSLGPALAGIALSRDARYVPYLRKKLASATGEGDYQKLLQALRGMSGPEARELRLDINKRIRQGAR